MYIVALPSLFSKFVKFFINPYSGEMNSIIQ